MSENSWPSEWMRGLLSLLVRRAMLDGPTYGYEISARLEESGFGAVKGGTLYPLLSRLEAAGDVETQWREGDGGPGRKYFRLTPEGAARFRAEADRWAAFAARTTDFITRERAR